MFFDGSSYYELDLGLSEPMPGLRLSGDFYHEADDVTRGLSLSLYNDAAGFNYVGETCKHEGPLATKRRSNLPISRFGEDDEALQVPEDDFFQLEQTTIVVSGDSSAHIGNRMIDFLRTEAASLITKVNCTKFTIKAEVCLDGLSCEIKVRIYQSAFGGHMVEMQRRSGDSIAFHRLYQWASQHLNSDANSQHLLVEPQGASVPLPVIDAGGDGSVAPLLDLVGNSGNAQLQAEGLQGLLHTSKNADAALQLCSTQAFVFFQDLLQIVCFSIAAPLSQLLCYLASLPETRHMFIDQQVLRPMIDKVWAKAAGQFVSEQLAKAVCSVIAQHAGELSLSNNRELIFALTEKMNGGAPEFAADAGSARDLETVHHLQESLQMLSLVNPFQSDQACHLRLRAS